MLNSPANVELKSIQKLAFTIGQHRLIFAEDIDVNSAIVQGLHFKSQLKTAELNQLFQKSFNQSFRTFPFFPLFSEQFSEQTCHDLLLGTAPRMKYIC